MKKIYNFILASALLASCADLNQTSLSNIDKNDFYKSESDLQVALNGVYQMLYIGDMHGIYSNELIYLNDLQSEYCERGTANSAYIQEIGHFAITPTNAMVQTTWEYHYQGINRANILIDKTQESKSISQSVRDAVINQAKFLRGLYYFDLVRYYGGVPIALHDGDAEGAPRNSEDEVYEQIVNDFTAAENIPEGFSHLTSVASSGAASGWLSKVYLWWAQADTEYSLAHKNELYQKAIDYANKVIGSRKYNLNRYFCDNWSLDKKENSELLFTVEHKFGINRNVTGHCVFSTGFSNTKLPVLAAVDNSLYDNFDPADQRREASMTKRLFNPYTGKYFDFERIRFRKYIDTIYMSNFANPYESGQSTSSSALRYAEILLVKAEAENELNGPTSAAYDAINQVRRRAYLDPKTGSYNQPTDGTTIDLESLTKDEFRKALQNERLKEFIMEGARWFDLKRWHILVKTIKEKVSPSHPKYKNISSKNYFLPIPQDQIELNPNLKQNWGWQGETSGDVYAAKGWQ